ncbi:MAG: flagellar filament capping protein FliD [Candidatus Sericytochromatia bacterium]|nr:flagellar filament capping protein FliD [Candidatus Sericytochromatia bacterium]
MSDIRFSGLASGIDTQSLIDKLIQLERRPIAKLQSQISQNNTKLERLRALSTKLRALSTAADKVMGPLGYASSPIAGRAGASSDPTVGTLTATSSAPKGSYTFTVNAVASDAKMLGGLTGRGATDTIDAMAVGANTYTITSTNDPLKTVTLTLNAATTLESLASAINGSATSPVTASITNSSTSESRLVLISKTGGAPGGFTLAQSGAAVGTAPNLASIGLAEGTATGTNASLSIDGSAAITSTSNTFVDALPGTTFTALKAGTTSITLDNDLATAKTALRDLVARYNEVLAQLREDTKYDSATQKSGPLRNEPAIRGLSLTLNRMVTEQFDDSGTNGTFTNYKAAGLTVNRDGSLALDEKVLDDALKSQPEKLYKLLGNEDGETTGGGSVRLNQGAGAGTMGDGIANRLKALVSSLTDTASLYNGMSPAGGRSPGLVIGAINSTTQSTTRFNSRIDGEERRVARREKLLRLQFQNMERSISGLRAQGSYLANQVASLQGQSG